MFDKRKYRLDGRKIIPFKCPTEKYDCNNCTFYEGATANFMYCAYSVYLSGDSRYIR